MWFRTESIEWHTHISDTIAVAEVSGIKELPSDSSHSRLWQAELTPVKALKGRRSGKLSVSQYHDKDRKPSIFSGVKLEAATRCCCSSCVAVQFTKETGISTGPA
jgi:hypothetical protein